LRPDADRRKLSLLRFIACLQEIDVTKNLALFAVLGTVLFALPVQAALTVGTTAPNFKATASLAGKEFKFSLKNARKHGPVVVYFYPSAFTGGCNLQAHTFAVNQDKFTAANTTVIGVSLDSIERLNAFSADPEYCGGKVAVASDVGGKIAASYDLKVAQARAGMKDSRGVEIDHGFAERTTFIVGKDGKIITTVGGVSPTENVQKALEAVQALATH
jgi:peroxiredoxin